MVASPDSIDSRIFTIDLHPQNPSRLLAASNTDGIFLSTDEGENWQQLSASPTRVWDLAFDSSAPNRVYAGTSDEGVYQSRDGGASWESINTGLYNRTIRTLAVNDAQTAEVFAGTFDGVYRSQDSGRTWQPASEGLIELSIPQLRTIPSGELIAALDSDGGIFVRTDGGEVWTAVPDPGTRITRLEVASTQPPTLYSASNRDGLFRSGDLGVTWNPINEGLSSLQITPPWRPTVRIQTASTREQPRVSIQLTTGEITGSPWGLTCTSTNSRSVPKAPRPFTRTTALSQPSEPETGGRPGKR